MLFNSFVFAGMFLPLCLLIFWMSPNDSMRRWVLLASSLFFYGYWFPPYLALLIVLVGVAWLAALAAERTHDTWPVWAAAIALLGTLGYFKYYGFVGQVVADLGLPYTNLAPKVALPLGISFIVFQALGYVVDVHRREFPAEKSYSVTLLFKAFFPQLIAGPICRAHELIPQLKGVFRFSLNKLLSGLAIFCSGLFLKVVFADGLAPLMETLYAPAAALSRYDALAAAGGFGAQIFADFWGYSSMAVGLALMFGIEIPINFKLPYLATSIRDFWRRWHITLSQWLRDYLYKSLGGSRNGRFRTMLALFATMLLGGLWHGANYTFLVWGAIHGVVLTAEHFLGRKPSSDHRSHVLARQAARFIGFSYTLLVVMIAWVFFRAENVPQAMKIIGAAFSGSATPPSTVVLQVSALVIALAVVQIPFDRFISALRSGTIAPAIALTASFFLTLSALVLGAPDAVKFIYFEF